MEASRWLQMAHLVGPRRGDVEKKNIGRPAELSKCRLVYIQALDGHSAHQGPLCIIGSQLQ